MPEYRKLQVGGLSTFEGNPRRGNVDLIARSLETNGQYRPIVVNVGTQTGRPNEVLAGNHTLLAARALGWESIDCSVIDVDEQRARSIVAADNRLADLGEYDAQELHALLSSLDDLDGTGYELDDLDALSRDLFPPDSHTDPDDVPDAPAEPRSEAGQVWQLGEHRLLVGSSTDGDAVRRLCGDVAPDCVWTDPPYGVEYVGKTKNALRIQNDGILYGFVDGGEGRKGRGGERWFGGNNETTVFEIDKPPRNAEHPTMKPVALIDAMLANSLPAGGVVLDPFSGSGSTLIAAHGRQSRAFCVELDPRYADVILRRFEAHTGIVPTLDGEPVSFVASAA